MKLKTMILVLVFGLMFVGVGAYAQSDETQEPPVSSSNTDQSRTVESETVPINTPTTVNTEPRNLRPRAAVKLEAKKLSICKKRQTVLKNTMSRMSDRAEKHIAWLDSSFEKTKTFYLNSGWSVSFSELVQNVDSARSTALQLQSELEQFNGEFSCDGDDPKTVIEDFKNSHSVIRDAIKAYKDSLKAFIQAIRAEAIKQNQSSSAQTGETN